MGTELERIKKAQRRDQWTAIGMLFVFVASLLVLSWSIERQGGLQCYLGKLWNSSMKIEGCP